MVYWYQTQIHCYSSQLNYYILYLNQKISNQKVNQKKIQTFHITHKKMEYTQSFIIQQNQTFDYKSRQMFKRLLSFSQIQRTFQQCKINKSHDFCHTKPIIDLYYKYNNKYQNLKNVNININISNTNCKDINIFLQTNKNKKNKKQEFIQFLINKFQINHDVLRIKCLIIMHRLIHKTFDQKLMTIVESQLENKSEQYHQFQELCDDKDNIEIKIEYEKQQFIKNNIIMFYIQYLKKFINNMETIRFAERYIDETCLQHIKSIEMVNKGFIILNLINYIITSMPTFSKMGRYYKIHKENLSLFINLLQDLTIYNNFIKQISKLSVNSMGKASSQQIKHYFLFISEAQKSSDRLYQFFHNRYYFEDVKNLIMMPRFMSFNHDQYNNLVKFVKKKDRKLVNSVQKSKYQRSKSVCQKKKMTKTQINQSQNSMSSLTNDKMPITERYKQVCERELKFQSKKNQKQKIQIKQKKFFQDNLDLLQPKINKKIYF